MADRAGRQPGRRSADFAAPLGKRDRTAAPGGFNSGGNACRVARAMNELLTNAEMAEADRLTVASGIPGIDLMENAGRAVADCVARRPLGTRVVVVAGPGNNGGDGFVAARVLGERGYPVRLLFVGDPARLKGDAAEAARRYRGTVEAATPEALAGAGVLIDSLFGAGLDRPVEGFPRTM